MSAGFQFHSQAVAYRKLLELVAAPAPQLAVGRQRDGVLQAAGDGHKIDSVGGGVGEGVESAWVGAVRGRDRRCKSRRGGGRGRETM